MVMRGQGPSERGVGWLPTEGSGGGGKGRRGRREGAGGGEGGSTAEASPCLFDPGSSEGGTEGEKEEIKKR